jgi:phage tail protein X
MVKTAVAGALVAIALASCGYSPCACDGSGTLPIQTSPSPGFGFDAMVTEKDKAITIQVGQKVEVVLRANPGMTDWSNVRSSDTSVLTPIVNPAATAVRGVTLAAFKTQAPGQAVITAVAGAACSPGQACPMYAILYSVTVTVTPSR